MEQTISIGLTKEKISAIFEGRNRGKWDKYLEVYDHLLRELDNAQEVSDYEKSFNYFYQVRRGEIWRKKFYDLFYSLRNKRVDFADIINELFQRTDRVEASFASKLAATLNPDLPIIDRHVLSYIGRKLPSPYKENKERIAAIITLHKEMEREFNAFLKTESGKYLLERFRKEYPHSKISEMKMLDFVLWQSGGKNEHGRSRTVLKI
jgi:hypothetical protein